MPVSSAPGAASRPSLQHYVRPMPGCKVEMYFPPSPEQLRLVRRLGPLVAPGDNRGSLLARVWGVFAVAPFAHWTFFSLPYQTYLYDIFHQTKNARFWHQVCMPLNVLMLLVFLAQFGAGATNGALIGAAVLGAWYFAQGVQERYYLWGTVSAGLMVLTFVLAAAYARAFFVAGAPWYAPTALPYNPLVWMAVLSFIQAASHGTEPRLPPRVTGSPYWMTVSEYIFGRPGARHGAGTVAVHALRTALQSVYGTIDEWWAAPRLFPFGILEQMWRHGYQRERFAVLDAMTQEAIASGEPAIDFIGSGGGAFLRLPDGE